MSENLGVNELEEKTIWKKGRGFHLYFYYRASCGLIK